jgi:competence protein ComEA
VTGAVAAPGVYDLPVGSRVQDALDSAGGLLEGAEGQALNLAAHLEDGDQLWVPLIGDQQTPPPPGEAGTRPAITRAESIISQGDIKLIEINTAPQDELESLPGIGPATASKIIAYREENGNFKTVEEIMNVSGIGPATFERIKDLISVSDK